MIVPVNKGTILIIDDQERSRSLYRALLLREGYEVLEAESGERGLELVKSAKPDVIILDLFLPALSGSDVLERIRADDSTKKIPIIVLSVEGEKDAIQKLLRLGAQDYLVKGFTPPKEVLSKLRTVMQKAGAKSPAPSYKIRIIEGQVDAPQLEQ
ncbi:MAG: response regulator, partial [Armatimonadetes bacterium]|nr:response regulator [Armatimonadota bacterium]